MLPGKNLQNMFADRKYSPETNMYWKVAKPVINSIYCLAKQPSHLKQARTFVRECTLVSQISHPNITKFVGVHFGKDKFDLTLFTELPPFDLPTYLTGHPGLPSPIQYSLLHDISSGLLYLHSTCCVIHRNLTASNILITAENQPKISNFECACFINDYVQGETLNTDIIYKAPEAWKAKPEYSLSTDIFSMGVLCLYVAIAIQDSPEFTKDEMAGPTICTSEISDKRREWVHKIESRQPELSPIVDLCLSHYPADRPSAFYLNLLLLEVKKEAEINN